MMYDTVSHSSINIGKMSKKQKTVCRRSKVATSVFTLHYLNLSPRKTWKRLNRLTISSIVSKLTLLVPFLQQLEYLVSRFGPQIMTKVKSMTRIQARTNTRAAVINLSKIKLL